MQRCRIKLHIYGKSGEFHENILLLKKAEPALSAARANVKLIFCLSILRKITIYVTLKHMVKIRK